MSWHRPQFVRKSCQTFKAPSKPYPEIPKNGEVCLNTVLTCPYVHWIIAAVNWSLPNAIPIVTNGWSNPQSVILILMFSNECNELEHSAVRVRQIKSAPSKESLLMFIHSMCLGEKAGNFVL